MENIYFYSAMWMNNYCDYHQFLFELEEYGDTDYLSINKILIICPQYLFSKTI